MAGLLLRFPPLINELFFQVIPGERTDEYLFFPPQPVPNTAQSETFTVSVVGFGY
jgi:hypothetical protein